MRNLLFIPLASKQGTVSDSDQKNNEFIIQSCEWSLSLVNYRNGRDLMKNHIDQELIPEFTNDETLEVSLIKFKYICNDGCMVMMMVRKVNMKILNLIMMELQIRFI